MAISAAVSIPAFIPPPPPVARAAPANAVEREADNDRDDRAATRIAETRPEGAPTPSKPRGAIGKLLDKLA